MCTAVSVTVEGSHYFGRNLDLERSYGERVVVTPRGLWGGHAMIGMAHLREGYPLYYDGVNEKGLCMAGLNFPFSAVYPCGAAEPEREGEEVAPFELIGWVLSRCADLAEARELLAGVRLSGRSFAPDLPLTPLHWLLADATGALVVEPTARGLRLIPDPVGVLTNEPPLEVQLLWLANFMGVSDGPPVNRILPGLELPKVSRGMGGLGLPGDLSSQSRFVRAAFAARHSHWEGGEEERISQFYHVLGAVEQPKGCVRLEDGKLEFTRYSCCISAARGVYSYVTYENRRPTAIALLGHDLDASAPISYPLRDGPRISWEGSGNDNDLECE